MRRYGSIFAKVFASVTLLFLLTGCQNTQNIQSAKSVTNSFLTSMQGHNYNESAKLFTIKAQKNIGSTGLQSAWKKMEQKEGTLKTWDLTGFYSSAGEYVVLNYQLHCSKGDFLLIVDVLQEKQVWKLGNVNFQV